MTPQEFQQVYPRLAQWIASTLHGYRSSSKQVSTLNFPRFKEYFDAGILQKARFVVVDQLPVPPLTQMGLSQFAMFESTNFAGITYVDTFFVKQPQMNESLFFHEMIHILQWDMLGPETFLALYADGLERFGYEGSPLEAMAYEAQRAFESSPIPFDAKAFVREKLVGTYPGITIA